MLCIAIFLPILCRSSFWCEDGKMVAKKTTQTKTSDKSDVDPKKKSTSGKPTTGNQKTASEVDSSSSAKKPSSVKKSASSKTKPVEKKKLPKYLTDETWLAKQKKQLIQEKASYASSAERLAEDAAALMADREPGDVQFDEESGEGDTVAVERDRDLALSASALNSVEEVDKALISLEEGVYGVCLASGEPIPKDRLEAIPEATVTVQHKTSMFI